MKTKVTVGITDCAKYPNYEKWMHTDPDVEVIRLGYKQNNFNDITKCDGILLTGGEDIHPARYRQPDLLIHCEQDDMDEKRDEFEWRVLQYTQDNDVPLLGICRGLQLGNVFFGGSLIPDLSAFGKPDHSKNNGIDRAHVVLAKPGSALAQITQTLRGEVNSAHHQCVDRVGNDLIVNAKDENDIIEGLERKDAGDKPFLLFVQWHPERMTNQESAFSKNVKESFIAALRK